MSPSESSLRWYARVAAWLRPGSALARELIWRRSLAVIQDAINDRRFDRIDSLLQELELELEAFPPGDDLPPRWNRLGDLHQELSGSNADSERLFRRALVLAESHPGPQSANLALSLNNLGLLLLHQRRFEQALPLFERLLPLVEEQFGVDNPEVATCLENVAAACRGLGLDEEARVHRSRAATIRRGRTGALNRNSLERSSSGLAPDGSRARFWLSGLAAGLILLGGEALLNGVLLADDWSVLGAQLGLASPGWPAVLLVVVLTLLLGVGLVWVYLVLSPAFGPESRTAVLAGILLWFPVFGYTCTWLAVIGVFPPALMGVAAAWGLGESVLAALAGRWLYRRE
jgi:tetratricopeptide (TPR) repeat protein